MSKKPTTQNPTNPSTTGNNATSPNLFDRHIEPAELDEMTRYGIKRVPVDYYHFGDFRYTNLPNAIAQAKRGCSTLATVEDSKPKGR